MGNIITRQQIVNEAKAMLGTPFLHQGRSVETGVDCVGFFVVLAKRLGIDAIIDKTDYPRRPDPRLLLTLLRANLDEIPVSEITVGDILLVRNGGERFVHTVVLISDKTDYVRGIAPEIIHSVRDYGVTKDWLSRFAPADILRGFAVRGVK